jgi:hypothetical protein
VVKVEEWWLVLIMMMEKWSRRWWRRRPWVRNRCLRSGARCCKAGSSLLVSLARSLRLRVALLRAEEVNESEDHGNLSATEHECPHHAHDDDGRGDWTDLLRAWLQ